MIRSEPRTANAVWRLHEVAATRPTGAIPTDVARCLFALRSATPPSPTSASNACKPATPSPPSIHLEEFLENKEANAASTVIDEDHADLHSVEKATWERNEAAALEEADLDLVRLDRYERLAWSQQKRAILEFMNIKLMKEMRGRKAETHSPQNSLRGLMTVPRRLANRSVPWSRSRFPRFVSRVRDSASLPCPPHISLARRRPPHAEPTLTCVNSIVKLTYMEKTQIYLRKEELDALRKAAARSGRSVAELIREAIRKVVLKPGTTGPVGVWDGEPKRASIESR